jgi:hypothetical protein
MARPRPWKLAVGLLIGASGCAHCDICDDPPVPCTGPGCSAALNVEAAPINFGTAPPSTTASPFAPYSPSGPTQHSAGGTTPIFTAPPLPDVPPDSASPPAPPVAPEKP